MVEFISIFIYFFNNKIECILLTYFDCYDIERINPLGFGLPIFIVIIVYDLITYFIQILNFWLVLKKIYTFLKIL